MHIYVSVHMYLHMCVHMYIPVCAHMYIRMCLHIIITEIQFSGYVEPLGIAQYVVKLYRMMFPYNVQFVFKIV